VMLGSMLGSLTAAVTPVRAQGGAAQTTAATVPLAEVVDVPHLDKVIKAAQGKVVLVNFWAAWNEPSAAQYPAFVFLYDRYHAKGLEVISVATDPTAEREAHVIPFIQNSNTKFPTYLKADGDAAAFVHGVDATWTGTLPRTYLIGRDGKVRQMYASRINAVKFEATIQRLLKEEAPKPKLDKNGRVVETPPTRSPRGILGG